MFVEVAQTRLAGCPKPSNCGFSTRHAAMNNQKACFCGVPGRLTLTVQLQELELSTVKNKQRLGASGRSVLMSVSANEDDRAEGKRIFIFGMGYTSLALAACLRRANWRVSGTCRSQEKKEALELRGFDAFQFNADNDGEELQEDGLRALQEATHVLTSVPPVGDFDKDPVLANHYEDIVELGALGKLRWIGVLSSTGVYGDHQGEWVDEETEVRPSGSRALARVEAEKSWLRLGCESGIPVHVFRPGGIYGPGRSAWETVSRAGPLSARQQLREGRGEQYTSRIHVADLCQAILASMQLPGPGKIFNVVDDDPAPRSVVMDFARKLRQGCDTVKNDTEGSTAIASSGKRVGNRRMKEELKVELQYPSYKAGLAAISAGVIFPFE